MAAAQICCVKQKIFGKEVNIGIKHGFSCINIRQGGVENRGRRPKATVFKTSQGTWRLLMHLKCLISHYFLHYFVSRFHRCLANVDQYWIDVVSTLCARWVVSYVAAHIPLSGLGTVCFFFPPFWQGRQFLWLFVCILVHQSPSEKKPTLKGENLLTTGANSFLLENTPLQGELKTILTKLALNVYPIPISVVFIHTIRTRDTMFRRCPLASYENT